MIGGTMAHFLCHLGCSHFGALLLDFYFTENIANLYSKTNGLKKTHEVNSPF